MDVPALEAAFTRSIESEVRIDAGSRALYVTGDEVMVALAIPPAYGARRRRNSGELWAGTAALQFTIF